MSEIVNESNGLCCGHRAARIRAEVEGARSPCFNPRIVWQESIEREKLCLCAR